MDVGDESRSWRDDTVVEVVHAFLSRVLSEAAREEIDLPHILICRDAETGAVTYSGPFPCGLDALAAAEAEREIDELTNDGVPLTFSVAALLNGVVPSPAGHREGGGNG